MAVALLCNYNFIYALAPFHNNHIAAASVIFIISMLSCTEKWKVYILLFSIGDSLFAVSDSRNYFLTSFSFFIAFEAYRTLVFKTAAENAEYFVGMATIFTYFAI